MSLNIRDATTQNLAEVTANKELFVKPTANPAAAGYVRLTNELGDDILLENRGRIDQCLANPLFIDNVVGANWNKFWTYTATVFSGAVAGAGPVGYGGQYNLLSGTAAANGSVLLNSQRRFELIQGSSLWFKAMGKATNGNIIDKTIELGFGYNNESAFVDGACFRWNASNQFVCVVSNASSEQSSGALTMPSEETIHDFEIRLAIESATFYIDGIIVATIARTSTQASVVGNLRLPVFARVYSTTNVPALAPLFMLGYSCVYEMGPTIKRPYSVLMSMLNNQLSADWTLTSAMQTANHANSAAPASATLSNTAAGYATLGGRYQFAAIAGAITDYALFAYLVPANEALVITGIKISCVNTGAAVAVTGTSIDWAIGVGSTAVSLVTADTFTSNTYGPRRIPLGNSSFAIGDGIGYATKDIWVDFSKAPLYLSQRTSGRYVHVICTVYVGTATASEIFRGDVTFMGYYDRLG